MKASELRIGNIVEDRFVAGVREVTILTLDDFQYMNNCRRSNSPNAYWEIPLTEEWLLKFGFRNSHHNAFVIDNKDGCTLFYVVIINSGIYHLETGTSVEYAHSLQNLYFALTGEELVIEDPIDILKIATKEAIAYKTRTTDSK